jgi:hypothetical protein
MLVVGCARMRATTDYDADFDFSSLRHYAWLPAVPGQRTDPRVHNDLIDARVRAAVDRALGARGFGQVPEPEADFFVNYYLLLDTRLDVRTLNSSFGYGTHLWRSSAGTQTVVTEYERGTLIVDVLAAHERRLVWRGSTNARLGSSTTAERRTQLINEAVETVMSRFPPD